jgi:ubiquinone/menaquinone biosynthesis C-methylase UbiE
MGIWARVFAAMYDPLMARAERAGLRDERAALIRQARGRVLEIGAGTGSNLPHYAGDVESLTLTDPEAPMLRRLERKGPAALVLRAPAEDLPFDDDSFDTVVSTLVLCAVDDQPRALREIRRVLRPGGKFLFLEHIRSSEPTMARKQDRLNGIQLRVGRCNCNRPTVDSIRAAGFRITELTHGALPTAPAHVRPMVVGVAQ